MDPLISSPQTFFASAPARLLAANMQVNVLRTNGLLRTDEWREIDQAVVAVAKQALVGIADLRAFNLIHPLGGLGTLISAYERASDMSAANVDMNGATVGIEDASTYDIAGVPIPIVHKDFRIGIRELEASRRMGNAVDTTNATIAAQKVAEGLESILFNGSTVKSGGYALYGYTTHPSRNTGSADGDFGTISNIYTTVNKMVAAARNDGYGGPYVLYVPNDQYAEMLAMYTDGSGQTALRRCVENIPGLNAVKNAATLTSGTLVLVSMQRNVVDLALAQDVVPVQWDDLGGMMTRFKVMAAMAPRIKSDAAGHSGIVHYTGA